MVPRWRHKNRKLGAVKCTGGIRHFPIVSSEFLPEETRSSASRRGDEVPLLKRVVVPRYLDDLPSHPLSAMILDDNKEESKKFISFVIAVEKRVKEIEILNAGRAMPNPASLSLAINLRKDIFTDAPSQYQYLLDLLWKFIEPAIFTTEVEFNRNAGVFADHLQRVPWFMLCRRQARKVQELLVDNERLNYVAETAEKLKTGCLGVTVRIQVHNRALLVELVFSFWHNITLASRKYRMQINCFSLGRVNDAVGSSVNGRACFMAWRLAIKMGQMENLREQHVALTREAGMLATSLSKERLKTAANRNEINLRENERLDVETKRQNDEQDHLKLKTLWDQTKPELIGSVLKQQIHFFNAFVVELLQMKFLAASRQFRTKDVSHVVTPGAKPLITSKIIRIASADILLNWVNYLLSCARDVAQASLTQTQTTLHRDLELFRRRLQQVEVIPQVDSYDGDFGPVLIGAFAYLRQLRYGISARMLLDPHDLRMLDEKQPCTRAELLLSTLRAFCGSNKAIVSLRPEDIVSGNSAKLVPFLAAAFIDFSGLPEMADPEENINDDDADTSDDDVRSTQRQDLQNAISTLLSRIETASLGLAFNDFVDPHLLLCSGEEIVDLVTAVSIEDLLLRWLNRQLSTAYPKRVENFSTDMSDGYALLVLLQQIAPHAFGSTVMPESMKMRDRIDLIVEVSPRVSDFRITAKIIEKEQADLIAAFLFTIFLRFPKLALQPSSLLGMHHKVLEKLVIEGYEVIDGGHGLTPFAVEYDKNDVSYNVGMAVEAFIDARRCMQQIYDRVNVFIEEVLAARAESRARHMNDAKEQREFVRFTSITPDRLKRFLRGQDTAVRVANELLGTVGRLLCDNFSLFRDMYRYYSTSVVEGTTTTRIMTLDSIMRLYQDIKLKCRHFSTNMVHTSLHEILDITKSEHLQPPGFIDLLLHFAHLRYGPEGGNIKDQLERLIQNNLIPYAMKESVNEFRQYVYAEEVREVFLKYEDALYAIFEVYAASEMEDHAQLMLSSMNWKEFRMFMEHIDALNSTFNADVLSGVFVSIQLSSMETCEVDEYSSVDIDDDNELSFSEFWDGLVAVVLYLDPNPFAPFHTRLEYFLMCSFQKLRRYFLSQRSNRPELGMRGPVRFCIL
eukprot:GEMP01004483.1.p1 GENE.GEMP01004483.1~~GEMP01004483.1.p1  ORF type:complete len:1134 (+),score=219.33 GEMP01004483.1:44-3445(+)